MQKTRLLFAGIAMPLLLLLLVPIGATAQLGTTDTTASVPWQQLAWDTSLTYDQVTTSCDSMFALVGVIRGTTDTGEAAGDNDNYARYVEWKNFWQPRLDANTGKIFTMSSILALRTSATTGCTTTATADWLKCNGVSSVQAGLGTIVPNGLGRHWLGPQNVTI